jgi:hypothetical protein
MGPCFDFFSVICGPPVASSVSYIVELILFILAKLHLTSPSVCMYSTPSGFYSMYENV